MKGKKTLTIYFDTELGLENFTSWYCNSGEQSSDYYVQKWGDNWMYVQCPENSCPKCEYFDEEYLMGERFDDEVKCRSCGENYIFREGFTID